MSPLETATGEPTQKIVNRLLRQEYGEQVTFAQLDEFKLKHGYMPFYIRKDPQYRAGRGVYKVPAEDAPLSDFGPGGQGVSVLSKQSPDAAMLHINTEEDLHEEVTKEVENEEVAFRYDRNENASEIEVRLRKLAKEASLIAVVPDRLKEFVPFGEFDMVKQIIASNEFFPVFTVGLSGNGKTLFPEQACAQLHREFINIDITSETDEDDLIGGFRLRNGETYFELGPAAVAMIRGTVLVLNELDLASPKIMCLQRVLEGKPLTIKKLGVVIKPAKGFTVFATANTKGRGDTKGKYIGTGYLNEAFLERFPITVEQEYPPLVVEKKILVKTFEALGGQMTAQTLQFFETLAKWAELIRKSYDEEAVEDCVSTRRLTQIVKAYKIFGSNKEAQALALARCTARFDAKVADAFQDFWNKLCPDDSPSNVGKQKGSTPF